MCNFASFVVTKDSVFWSQKTDSHQSICEEHHLYTDGVRSTNVVPVELVPPDGDYTAPVDKWIFSLDDNISPILPEWWDADRAEKQCRAMLPDQIAEKIILPGQVFEEIKDKNIVACYGKIKKLSGTSQVGTMRGTSQVGEMWETSQVGEMKDFATTKKYDGDKCEITCADPSNFTIVKHIPEAQA